MILMSILKLSKVLVFLKQTLRKDFFPRNCKKRFSNTLARAEKLGVESFPTLILEKGNKRTIIAQGYTNFEELDNILLNE